MPAFSPLKSILRQVQEVRKMKTVLGIFSEREMAESAIARLEEMAYNPKDISILMKDRSVAKDMHENTGADVAGGALSGATTGGVLGALAGLLVSTGVIPGLGALFVGGPLAVALGLTGVAATAVSGAATGALAGGVIGALTGLGLSDDEARVYESRIQDGGILVAVPARSGEEDEVRVVLEENGADQIRTLNSNEERAFEGERGYETPVAYASEVRRKSSRSK